MLNLKPQTPLKISEINKEETFEEFKQRKFDENYKKLYNLIDKNPSKFEGIELRKKEGRVLSLWKGGTKLITLFNQEIWYHETSDFIRFLRSNLEDYA
jgi:hypothetical protein